MLTSRFLVRHTDNLEYVTSPEKETLTSYEGVQFTWKEICMEAQLLLAPWLPVLSELDVQWKVVLYTSCNNYYMEKVG